MTDLDIVDSIADLDPVTFDALDRSAGAAGSYQRMLQIEEDRRWRVRFARAWRTGQLNAVIPLFTCRGRAWVDPVYDPGTWGIPGGPFDSSPDRVMLVAGCADLRTGLRVGPGSAPEQVKQLLVRIAALAVTEERFLAFPYFYADARAAISDATAGMTSWTYLGKEARFNDTHLSDREGRLRSRVRGVLRRDRRNIAKYGFRTGVERWAESSGEVLDLIATHNVTKGQKDHPEFVRMRHDQWNHCDGVEVVTFTLESATTRGVLTALVWSGELELYEVGLSGHDGPERMAAYASLLFHQPLAFAAEHGLRCVRAGLAAETPKSSRGASFSELSGGVLLPDKTRRQADAVLT
ncbi:hypothetical protein OWR29_39340 [Actinoplanes sp. Pm04-4]|uniref:BioF2-like acetyltransferase domain-containing protein n=1 Tax=Paractinoplanes pyxinae TaxID=2997416 RepID=A0ABT4BDL5_9ACTN|nr:hypothetical protein [Actinoplanes pyxinae]MCY1144087.1 hypothetical protein [Actinoplanes pyxinae]